MAAIDVFDFAMLAVTEAVVREAIAMRRNAVAVGVAITIDCGRDTAGLVTCGHQGSFAPAALKRSAYPADAGHR